ncbi:hypothetical protein ACO0SA_003305 [Hanseniaspora valbyensis]
MNAPQTAPNGDASLQYTINNQNFIHNIEILKYIQDSTSLLTGCCCGLLQFRNYDGFIFFIIQYLAVLAGFVLIYNGGNLKKLNAYYISPISNLVLDNLFRELASFTMAWILCNCIVS